VFPAHGLLTFVDGMKGFLMSSAPSHTGTRALRPSQVIAEALIDRQKPAQILHRARQLGFSPDLTTAVVAACCPEAHDISAAWTAYAEYAGSKSSPQS